VGAASRSTRACESSDNAMGTERKKLVLVVVDAMKPAML
jgi:hypothetical protein